MNLKERMSLDILGSSWTRAQSSVRILHQQLLQKVLSDGSDHGGERRITAQDPPEEKRRTSFTQSKQKQ